MLVQLKEHQIKTAIAQYIEQIGVTLDIAELRFVMGRKGSGMHVDITLADPAGFAANADNAGNTSTLETYDDSDSDSDSDQDSDNQAVDANSVATVAKAAKRGKKKSRSKKKAAQSQQQTRPAFQPLTGTSAPDVPDDAPEVIDSPVEDLSGAASDNDADIQMVAPTDEDSPATNVIDSPETAPEPAVEPAVEEEEEVALDTAPEPDTQPAPHTNNKVRSIFNTAPEVEPEIKPEPEPLAPRPQAVEVPSDGQEVPVAFDEVPVATDAQKNRFKPQSSGKSIFQQSAGQGG